MKYRPDIDGLRAVSVIAVIIFHSGFSFLSGGYVGVDIFFVISGYLITGLVFDEIKSGNFTFANFYKRRIARLLPALNLTLLAVFLFGFLFYDNDAFDNLGKEIFFSALGAANILFGQGINYFAQEDSIRPLIHLWSLGVEEQFYIVWPTTLIILSFMRLKHILITVLVLFLVSFSMAVSSVETTPVRTFFFPHYRAFALLAGAFTALGMRSKYYNARKPSTNQKEFIAALSMVLILAPMFLLDKNSTFPGFNTLGPCIGTALLIAFCINTKVSKVLGFTPLVGLGLISYPLYLYHQPLISYLQFFGLAASKMVTLFLALLVSIPLSGLTYRYIEKPIRSIAHHKGKSSAGYVLPLSLSLAFLAIAGILVAKTNGFGLRFQILNPFAYQVADHSANTFHGHFTRGLNVSVAPHGKILFVGDSALQQYVYPFIKALDINEGEVDTITRGGCVFLKLVEFRDKFSDISCNGLRQGLYAIDKHYDHIVISQSWFSYDNQITNFEVVDPNDTLSKWKPFIDATVEHFKTLSNNIILIGPHLEVAGTTKLRPTIFLSEDTYRSNLSQLKVTNSQEMRRSRSFFENWESQEGVLVIYPHDIWYNDGYSLHDGKWSFFSDSQHISNASTAYALNRITGMF